MEGMPGEQTHERVDRLIAVAAAARGGGWLGLRPAASFRLAGHDGLLAFPAASNLVPRTRPFRRAGSGLAADLFRLTGQIAPAARSGCYGLDQNFVKAARAHQYLQRGGGGSSRRGDVLPP